MLYLKNVNFQLINIIKIIKFLKKKNLNTIIHSQNKNQYLHLIQIFVLILHDL